MLDNLLKEEIIDRIFSAQTMVLMVDSAFTKNNINYSSLTRDDINEWLTLCGKIAHEVAYSDHIRQL